MTLYDRIWHMMDFQKSLHSNWKPLNRAIKAAEACMNDPLDEFEAYDQWKRTVEDPTGGYLLGENYWRINKFDPNKVVN